MLYNFTYVVLFCFAGVTSMSVDFEFFISINIFVCGEIGTHRLITVIPVHTGLGPIM